MSSNAERIQDYFYRQYESQEGTVEDNIYETFSEDVVYHVGEGQTVPLQAVVQIGKAIRQTPDEERIMSLTNFEEDGNIVTFDMHVRYLNPQSGEYAELESGHRWRFDENGMVVEVTPTELSAFSDALGDLADE